MRDCVNYSGGCGLIVTDLRRIPTLGLFCGEQGQLLEDAALDSLLEGFLVAPFVRGGLEHLKLID